MVIELLKYLLQFLLILLVQLLVVNNLQLSTYINPYIYPVIILSLPVSVKPWQILFISFFCGMIIDSFSSTPGLHMAALTLMGYLRGFYLRFSLSKEDFDKRIQPTLSEKGPIWFMVYASVLLLAHHLILFYFEIYSFKDFFGTLGRVLSSALFSLLLIALGQLLFYRSESSRGNGFIR